MIEVQFQEFSEKEKDLINEALNSQGFALIVKAIEGMADYQSVDLVNSLPSGQFTDSAIKTLIDSGEELSKKKVALEVLNEIITGKLELKKAHISIA